MKNLTMKKTIAMSVLAMAVAGCSDDELPDKNGNSFGQLTLAGEAIVGETLSASIVDANGIDESAITYSWLANGTAIADASSSSLMLTEALAGSSISVSVQYVDNDDYEERITSQSTDAVFDPFANIEGSLVVTGEAKTGEMLTAVLADDNGLENASVVYKWMANDDAGAVEIGNGGTELLLTDNEVGKTITVEATYTDDMDHDEMLTSAPTSAVLGSSVVIPKTQAAVIMDTKGDDAGELRYKGSDEVAEGKLSVSVLKNPNVAGKDAYIGLYNSSTSTYNAIIDLKIRDDGKLYIRPNASGEDDIEVPNIMVTPGTWFDVEMAWETTDEVAGGEELAEISVTIDGQDAGTYSTNSQNALVGSGNFVRTVIFKLGDTGTQMDPSETYQVDNIVFSNLDGSTVYHEDDFESYALDTDLNGIYDGSTSEAMVKEVDGVAVNDPTDPPVDPGPVNLNVVKLTDTDDGDTAELRYKLSDSLTMGKVSVSIRKDTGEPSKDSYVSLYNSSTSSSNSYIDLRLHQDGTFEIRDNVAVIAQTFVLGEWVDVDISFNGEDIKLMIDGVDLGSFKSQAANGEFFLQTVALRMGDNGSVNTGTTYVDNLAIYSDEAGTVEVFADDFEGYVVGEVLGDGTGDDYNSSSSEAVVADRPADN